MPGGMNGRELAEEVTQLCPEIKILYMSGHTDNIIALQNILPPKVNFLQKPFSIDTLTKKVRAVLDSS